MNPKSLMKPPKASWYDIPGVPQEPDQIRKTETEVPIQEMSGYAIPCVHENEIPSNCPNSNNAKINQECIPWKNEEQEPQVDSIKPEPSDIMMDTMPTQR